MEKSKKKVILTNALIIISVLAVVFAGMLYFKPSDKKAEVINEEKEEIVVEKVEEKEKVDKANILFFDTDSREVIHQKNGKNSSVMFLNGEEIESVDRGILNIRGLKAYKTGGRLFFVDLDYDTVTEVSENNGEIVTRLILSNEDVFDDNPINMEDVFDISVSGDSVFITTHGGSVIEVTETNKQRYVTGLEPKNVFKLDDNIFFMDRSDLVKSVKDEGRLVEIERLNIGAMLSDFKIDGETLYGLNMFGEKENKSVIMNIDLNNFLVKDIMPIEGIDSRFIGFEGNTAFIGQEEGVKEVNLETFEPLKSISKEKSEKAEFKNGYLYKLKGNKIEQIQLTEDARVLEKYETNLNDFFVLN